MKPSDIKRITSRRLGQALFNAWLSRVPSIVAGRAKVMFLRRLGASIGQNVKISNHVKVLGPQKLTIGSNVSVAHSAVLDARGGLEIKDGALVGFESVLLTYTHASPDPTKPVHHQGTVQAPVEVGANSWIGARCIILPGSVVGTSSIIGAMSVVTTSIPADSVAVGAPARVMGQRQPGAHT